MPQPGERRAIRLFAHARDERRSVVEHPVLERPGTAPWFARALAMMPQVGEPDVEPRGAEKMRHPGVQPEAVVGKGAMDEENSRAAIPIGANSVQGKLDAIGRGETPSGSRHSYRPAARYASSSSSTGCRARAAIPSAECPAPICIRHSGHTDPTTCGAPWRESSI